MPEIRRIGILGGGQLGKMLTDAAHKLGKTAIIFSDADNTPACQVADQKIIASYDNQIALKKFAESCDVITYEFENIPVKTAEFLQDLNNVVPDTRALKVFQNRILEKEFLRKHLIPCAEFCIVRDKQDFSSAIQKINFPCVLKTAGMGYDGKGQTKIRCQEDAEKLLQNWSDNEYVLEKLVNLKTEFSIVAASDSEGNFVTWGAIENEHRNHILHISILPGRINQDLSVEAQKIAKKIALAINYTGVFCVEFFITDDNSLLVNEIAPRVHNSGHLTIEASECSQFEQHIRAVSGMNLGSTAKIKPAAMLNLLGDLWRTGEPDWLEIVKKHSACLHLYGKEEAKPGRKMGHLTVLSDNADNAYIQAARIYNELNGYQ